MNRPTSSTDFSRVADFYDRSRNLPESILLEAYNRLIAKEILWPGARILDLGCGTGQVSLVLAKMGFSITGVDISQAMMERYILKLDSARQSGQVTLIRGDATDLPFGDNSFDLVFSSKLFQHIGNWQLAVEELLRVCRSYFILVTELGATNNQIRRHAVELASEMGYTERYPGPTTLNELARHLVAKGCAMMTLETVDLLWENEITYEEIFNNFQQQLHAEFWYMSEIDYQRLLVELEKWIESQPLGMKTREMMHPYLVVQVFNCSTTSVQSAE